MFLFSASRSMPEYFMPCLLFSIFRFLVSLFLSSISTWPCARNSLYFYYSFVIAFSGLVVVFLLPLARYFEWLLSLCMRRRGREGVKGPRDVGIVSVQAVMHICHLCASGLPPSLCMPKMRLMCCQLLMTWE